MDPVTAIATALALGAASGLKDITKTAVKDTYEGLKALIKSKFKDVNVDLLDQAPSSKSRRQVIEEDLRTAGVHNDDEVLKVAHQLLTLVLEKAPETVSVVGVDLEDVEAASLSVSNVKSDGRGVVVKKARIADNIDIKGVRAGSKSIDSPKKN